MYTMYTINNTFPESDKLYSFVSHSNPPFRRKQI